MINKLVDKIVRQCTRSCRLRSYDEVIFQSMFKRKLLSSMEKLLKVRQKLSGSIIRQSLIIYMIFVPAVKPQIAMYEQFGIEGLKVFKKTVDYCHEKDMVVIGDVKRGDIGSTSEAYAVAHLGKVKLVLSF